MSSYSPLLHQFFTNSGGATMIPFVLLCAVVWGIGIALFMQHTELGLFLSMRLTWFMTALGCGGNLLLLLLLINGEGQIYWWQVVAVFGVSSLGPSLRGILLHKNYFMEWINGARDTAGE